MKYSSPEQTKNAISHYRIQIIEWEKYQLQTKLPSAKLFADSIINDLKQKITELINIPNY